MVVISFLLVIIAYESLHMLYYFFFITKLKLRPNISCKHGFTFYSPLQSLSLVIVVLYICLLSHYFIFTVIILQVLRDIIQDHMEEIKQAGGIGCYVKAATDTEHNPVEPHPQYGTTHFSGLHNNLYDLQETNRESPSYRKLLNVDASRHGTSESYHMRNSNQKSRYEKYEYGDDLDRSRHDKGKTYDSESSVTHRSNFHLHDRKTQQKKQNDEHGYRYERDDSDYYSRKKDHNTRSTLTSRSLKRGYDYVSEDACKERSRTHERRRSESVTQDAFGDRYDPIISHEDYDARNNQLDYDRVQEHGTSTRRHLPSSHRI